MADLKTDYKDDILDTDVNTNRKYQMIDNGDGTVSFVDVTTYTQQGDGYGAAQINEQNTVINQINSDLSDKANPIVDIVANGTKTYQQLLTEVYNAYQESGKTLSDRATLKVRNNVAQLSSGQKLSFVFIDITASYINFSEYSLVDKTYLDATVNSNGTITINNGTTGTLASGSHIKLYL